MNDVEEFYLQHYGVKGMKWGVRKSASRAKNRVKKEYRSFRRERSQLGMKSPGSMTNKELQKALTRNRLENQLKNEFKNTERIGNLRYVEKYNRKRANRQAYLDRASLSDEQLQAKVTRMRNENFLVREANSINKKSIEAGEAFMDEVGDSVVKDLTTGNYNPGAVLTKALLSGASGASSAYLK